MADQPTTRPLGTRTKARKRALDILFEADLRAVDPLVVLADHTDWSEPAVRPFTTALVEGVVANLRTIDELIKAHLAEGWSLDRMPRVDRNLARISVYEMVHTDIAQEIAVSEAVTLSQDLSTDDSPAFLNGVLRAIAERRHQTG